MKRLLLIALVIMLALATLVSCGADEPPKEDARITELRALETPEEQAERLETLSDGYVESTNAIEMSANMQITDLPISEKNGVINAESLMVLSIHRATETGSLYTKSTVSLTANNGARTVEPAESTRHTVRITDLMYIDGKMYMSSSVDNDSISRLVSDADFDDFLYCLSQDESPDTIVTEDILYSSVTVTESEDGCWTVAYKDIGGEALKSFEQMTESMTALSSCIFSSVDITVSYNPDLTPKGIAADYTYYTEEGERINPIRLVGEVKYHNSTAPARSTDLTELTSEQYVPAESLATAFKLQELLGDLVNGECPSINIAVSEKLNNGAPTTKSSSIIITDKEKLEMVLTQSYDKRTFKYIYKDGYLQTILTTGDGATEVLDREKITRDEVKQILLTQLNPTSLSGYNVISSLEYSDGLRIILSQNGFSSLGIYEYAKSSSIYYDVYFDEKGEIKSFAFTVNLHQNGSSILTTFTFTLGADTSAQL